MVTDRSTSDREALSEVVNWAHATLLQIERVEAAFRAAQLNRRSGGWWGQADADLYRDEHADKTLLLVAANHVVTALRRCRARIGVHGLSDDLTTAISLLRDIYEHWDMYYYNQQRGREPSRKYRELLSEFPDAMPWSTHWNHIDGLTLGGVLHLPTLRAEMVDAGRSAWEKYEDLSTGLLDGDELIRLRPARFVPKTPDS